MSKVLITQSKIEDIANRLRAKTNINENISLEQMKIDSAGTPSQITEEIPSYIRTEAKRLANVVKSRQESCTNYVSFIAVSDIHHSNDTNGSSIKILKHCSMGAYLVKKYVPIDFGIMLGDYIRGSSIDTEEGSKAQYLDVLNYFSSFVDIQTQGNHDCGMGWWPTFLNNTDLYNRIGRFARNAVRPATDADRGYFYYDVPDKNFRVIVLNTNDIKGMAIKPYNSSNAPQYFDGHRFSMVQLKWLRDVLLNIPSGYSFIVCSHEPIHWGDSQYTDANNVTWYCKQLWRDLLTAYVNGTSYSITLDGETITGNFSNLNVATLVGTFHGHTHNFIYGTYGDANIVRIGTPNACNARTNEYGSTSYPQTFRENFGELDSNGNQVTTYFKTAADTTNETAFVVNTIDLDNKIIYSDYYGAGHNRMVTYGTVINYTVTRSIGSHCSIDNDTNVVQEGSSYTATISVDTGYTATVTITMGGTDVTSTVYNSSTGAINISSVTGNIVITATAIFTGNYVPIVGYTDNARWSAGDGTIRTGTTGFTAVNEISIDRTTLPAEFTLSGIDWYYNSNCILVAYKQDNTLSLTKYLTDAADNTNAGIKVEHMGNGVVKLTFYQGTQTTINPVKFKVSGYGTGANASITRTQ